MTRAEAIGLLVQRDLAQLTSAERESLLQDWWSIDADDPEYGALPDVLKSALTRAEGPDDPDAAVYEPLLRIALRQSYKGLLNSYLQRQIATLGRNEAVVGELEILEPCPCCGYRTLDERGGYDICPVCFWEDDGTSELDRHSGPNHMTLREARANFQCFGAVTEADSGHILPDGKQRYASVCKMRMNNGMSQRVERLRAGGELNSAELALKLAKLAAANLVETAQGIALEPLLPQTLDSFMFQDKTGFEAWTSKIHVEDFVDETEPRADEVLLQGLLYAERLVAKLAASRGSFRVFLCVDNDSNDVTCRFHLVREGEPWFLDDPNLSTIESIAIWDVVGVQS